MAYGIARGYSRIKGAPIHTYELTVPLYDVIVALNHSDMERSFEFLIWQGVSRSGTKHLYEEPPDQPVSVADYADNMKRRTSPPHDLIEPSEP
jgi:hypothetical protein